MKSMNVLYICINKLKYSNVNIAITINIFIYRFYLHCKNIGTKLLRAGSAMNYKFKIIILLIY